MAIPNVSTISPVSLTAKRLSPTRRTKNELYFKDITPANIPAISALLQMARSRTNDYTIGGIYMWIDYFKYRFCIVNDTLFLSGVTENHPTLPAFSLPIGKMPLRDAVRLLENYCAHQEIPLRFSAIPADRLAEFMSLGRWEVEPLTDWSDYLYDIKSLATLSGKKLSKKRNHVNRFMADNPGAHLDEMTPADATALVEAMTRWESIPDDSDNSQDDSATRDYERQMTIEVISNLDRYPMEGAVLRLADGRIVAFTIAERIGDTLFVHIEKMDHTVSGAGETVNNLFAKLMSDKYPSLLYANREEDCGDPGLRRAKESYRPIALLDKFNLRQL